jgi:hypothetical protein
MTSKPRNSRIVRTSLRLRSLSSTTRMSFFMGSQSERLT